MKKAVEIFVGIDISKAWLDVAVHGQDEVWRTSNDEAGIRKLVERRKPLQSKGIVVEPPGGFEIRLLAELAHAGLPVVVVNAKRIGRVLPG